VVFLLVTWKGAEMFRALFGLGSGGEKEGKERGKIN